MTRISEIMDKSISAQCNPPGRESSRICKCTPIMVLIGTLHCHSLPESNDAIFHILKGAPKEVNAETTSPHKSLFSYESLSKEAWRTGGFSVHSLLHVL